LELVDLYAAPPGLKYHVRMPACLPARARLGAPLAAPPYKGRECCFKGWEYGGYNSHLFLSLV